MIVWTPTVASHCRRAPRLISLIERNVANIGDSVAYRYLDHSGLIGRGGVAEVTWAQFELRLRAIGAHVQRLAGFRRGGWRSWHPRGIDYVAGFYAAIKGGHHRGAVVRPGNCRATPNVSTPRCATRSPPSC